MFYFLLEFVFGLIHVFFEVVSVLFEKVGGLGLSVKQHETFMLLSELSVLLKEILVFGRDDRGGGVSHS